jgi:UDP-N-acetylmuramoylalanine--D-glutamate ligase
VNHTPSLKNCNVWVAGAARSGIGAARLLKEMGAKVFVSDSGIIDADNKRTLEKLKITFEEYGHSLDTFAKEADLLVLSPAILLDRGIAATARKHGIPIVSEIEVASWKLRGQRVCGITGTNGKSTTTNYLAQLLTRASLDGEACGNIGKSFSVAIHEKPSASFVVELSSYQLETTASLRPKCTVFLNLQNDHLARYENIDDYIKAKWRLVMLTADDGIACIDGRTLDHALRMGLPLPKATVVVLGRSCSRLSKIPDVISERLNAAKSLPMALYHDLRKLHAEHIHYAGDMGFAVAESSAKGNINVHFRYQQNEIKFCVETPCLPGAHNADNILAASVVAHASGVPAEIIKEQWESATTHYVHLPHRLERIGNDSTEFLCPNGQKKKLWIVNDSKATNVESVIVALKSYQRPIHLLIGGDPKGESYAPLALFSKKTVATFHPFGKAGADIQSELSSLTHRNTQKAVPSLFDAAAAALEIAKDDDIILLSPACASFDEFQNFEHRGDCFRTWVQERIVAEKANP